MPLQVIRHAHTTWNGPPRRFQGRSESDLSQSGREATIAVAGNNSLKKPAKIYCSPARRCQQTAQLLFGDQCTPVLEERLWEIDVGCFSGLLVSEVQGRYPDLLKAWQQSPDRIAPGNGEPVASLSKRVTAAITDILAAHPSEHVTVVTHGGPIRCLLLAANNMTFEHYHELEVPNLSVFDVAIVGGQLRLNRQR